MQASWSTDDAPCYLIRTATGLAWSASKPVCARCNGRRALDIERGNLILPCPDCHCTGHGWHWECKPTAGMLVVVSAGGMSVEQPGSWFPLLPIHALDPECVRRDCAPLIPPPLHGTTLAERLALLPDASIQPGGIVWIDLIQIHRDEPVAQQHFDYNMPHALYQTRLSRILIPQGAYYADELRLIANRYDALQQYCAQGEAK